VHFSKFAEAIELPRGDRIGAIRRYASEFAKSLETQIAATPLQWFNFYSFWAPSSEIRQDSVVVQRAAE
jgi:predicted LPLAT superfamily acyltransferase